MTAIVAGDIVRTPLGTGVVREVRRNGRLLVAIGDRGVVVEAGATSVVAPPSRSARKRRAPEPRSAPDDSPDRRGGAVEVDLHGVVVAEALDRVLAAVNAAVLGGHARLRLIHGRSGGKLRAALHRALPGVPSVRAFRIDPDNEGVTIVEL